MMNQTVDVSLISQALAPWSRLELGHFPTPLEQLPRFSANFSSHSIYIKRDDCSGLGMGGNKVRQLEFYMGDAIDKGCDVVLGTGAIQSNYMRTLAAAAARLGLECHIQLESRVKTDSQDYLHSGNVLLNKMFGAQLHYYDGSGDEFDADLKIRQIADRLSQQGKKPYIVPLVPVEQPRGALGYVRAAAELMQQLAAQAINADLLVVGSGSGLTHAGLLTGLRMAGVKTPVLGVCVRREAKLQQPRILATCRKVETMLGCGQVVPPPDIWVDQRALYPGYGKASEPVMQAIATMAGTEGILLDPVYSGKTVACAMLAMAAGELRAYHNIIIIHTGGTPAIFAYRQALQRHAIDSRL